MNSLETLTRQSRPVDVLEILTSGQLFSPIQIGDFVKSKNYSIDVHNYDSLKKLVDSELFRTRFEKQWGYETDSKWKDRTVKIAIRETILHTTSQLAQDAQLELMGKRKGQFPGMMMQQIEIMDKQMQFLNDYYHAVLKGAL